MFGNDESHKRAARRRLQRISLAAALVACTTTAASAIDPPLTSPATSETQFNLMPPLPLSIGRLESSTGRAESAAGRVESSTVAEPPVERSLVKGIRQNPFIAAEAATANIVARVSGTEPGTPSVASPPAAVEPVPVLLRANTPVLTLRPIASVSDRSASRAQIAPGEQKRRADTFKIPPADDGAPREPEKSPTASAGRVTFAISDDGVRAKATLGQPADEQESHTSRSDDSDPQGTGPATETGPAAGLAKRNTSATARSPRVVAAAAPAITLDLPPTAAEPLPEEPEEPEEREESSEDRASIPSASLAATGESRLRKFSVGKEPASESESVLEKREEPQTSGQSRAVGPKPEPANAPLVAKLARRPKPHSSVTDRQPVVIATTTTPVARVSNKPKPQPPSPPASPPEATLVRPSRTLVIDAPASRSVALATGGGDVAAANVKAAVAETITIQSAETQTITPSGPVRRVRLEDREICEAVLVGPHKLLLIGRRDGTTRLAVWSNDEDEPSLYDVTVVSREAAPAGSPLHAVAERLTETIAATYPSCQIQVSPQGDGLNVSGQANSNESAREIMRLVRRACLKSVHDNLEIR